MQPALPLLIRLPTHLLRAVFYLGITVPQKRNRESLLHCWLYIAHYSDMQLRLTAKQGVHAR